MCVCVRVYVCVCVHACICACMYVCVRERRERACVCVFMQYTIVSTGFAWSLKIFDSLGKMG